MTFTRQVLAALRKDELQEIARRLELEVTSRMTVDELVDAVAKSKRASIAAIVQDSMSRDTLKAICVACGLDDTGKEKAPLVARIVAAGSSTGPICQRHVRQSLPDIFVPMGGEWSPTRAQAIPSFRSNRLLREGRTQAA